MASRYLKLPSSLTMKLAEELYQKGYISYPRTETDIFPGDLDHNTFIAQQQNNPKWGNYAAGLVQGKFKFPKPGKNSDNSHPPIYPTKALDTASFTENHRKLYEFITRHYLACCSDDGIGSRTTVTFQIGETEKFSISGLVIKQKNFLEVYPYLKWTNTTIPQFSLNELIIPESMFLEEGKTYPLSLLSESELIQKMDEHGIGTDATIATHIETIQNRGYSVKDDDDKFVPTNLGMALVDGYEAMDLASHRVSKPQLRAKMEAEMNAISLGRKLPQNVLQENLGMYRNLYLLVAQQVRKLDEAMGTYFEGIGRSEFDTEIQNFSTCGTCGKYMKLRVLDGGDVKRRIVYCEACDQSHSIPGKGDIRGGDVVCPLCKFQVVQIDREQGGSYTVCPYCYHNPPPSVTTTGSSTSSNMPCFLCTEESCGLSGAKGRKMVRSCPGCGKPMTVKSGKEGKKFFVGCSGYPGCSMYMPLPEVLAVEVTDRKCEKHGNEEFRMLKLTFGRNRPLMGLPTEFIGCVGGCDRTMVTLLETASFNPERLNVFFQSPRVGNATRNTTNNTTNTATGNGGRGGSASISLQTPQPMRQAALAQTFQNLNSGVSRSAVAVRTQPKTAPTRTQQQPPKQTHYQPQREQNTGGSRYGNQSADETSDQEVTCACNKPAVMRTVSKETANKGRAFWACPKPQSDASNCRFFQWADEEPNTSTNQGFTSYSGGSGGGSGSGGGGGGTTCFKCDKRGHYAKDCPAGRGAKETKTTAKRGVKRPRETKTTGTGRGVRLCGICREPGHNARSCPDAGGDMG